MSKPANLVHIRSDMYVIYEDFKYDLNPVTESEGKKAFLRVTIDYGHFNNLNSTFAYNTIEIYSPEGVKLDRFKLNNWSVYFDAPHLALGGGHGRSAYRSVVIDGSDISEEHYWAIKVTNIGSIIDDLKRFKLLSDFKTYALGSLVWESQQMSSELDKKRNYIQQLRDEISTLRNR